jgi:hypothetical protein
MFDKINEQDIYPIDTNER